MQHEEYLSCIRKLLIESPVRVPGLPLGNTSNNGNAANNEDDIDGHNVVPPDLASMNPSLRPINALGRISLSPTARSRFRCAWCDVRLSVFPVASCASSSQASHPQPWKECTKCRSSVYCSSLCLDQDKKIGSHRKLCARIRRHQEDVSAWAVSHSEVLSMDIFDRAIGMVFYFASFAGLGSTGKGYMRLRKDLVDSLVMEGTSKMINVAAAADGDGESKLIASSFCDSIPPPHWNSFALEVALEQSLDILHLDPVVNCCFDFSRSSANSIRTGIAHSLLVLERYQDLYDYVKYWNVLPHKLRQMHRRPVEGRDSETRPEIGIQTALDVALGPKAFMQTTKQAVFENQRELVLRLPSRSSSQNSGIIPTFPGPSVTEVICILYVTLAKLLVLDNIEIVQMVVQHCLSIEAQIITVTIGSYLDLSSDWIVQHPDVIRNQCRELLAFANSSIPGILETLIEKSRLAPVDYHQQTFNDTPTPIELLRTAWFHHSSPWTFLVDFVSRIDTYHTLIPRNHMVQEALDHVYSFYAELHISDPEYRECRQHWERVKDTEAVRTLLTDQIDDGGHLFGSSFYPTQMFLRLANQSNLNRAEYFELLFGRPDVSYSAMRDVDLYLAHEHLFQVRYLPETISFCKVNDVAIPDEPDDEKTVLVLLGMLADRGLTTPANMTLLFGDDNRLGAWFLKFYG